MRYLRSLEMLRILNLNGNPIQVEVTSFCVFLEIDYVELSCSSFWGDINPFPANVPIFYHLKTPENYDFFREYLVGTLARNGLIEILEGF